VTARETRYRRPESVLVVIYTTALDCLVLERVAPPDFWQSVTGTLRWDESAAAAAAREVEEETGLDPAALSDARTTQRFPILPAWRDRYAPGTESNLEHWWYLALTAQQPVRLNAAEHKAYLWLPLEQAIDKVASWTNRAALERLRPH
jgi:dATP pyrophosphohydrolase